MSKRTVVLTILDGWGIGNADASNPIYTVNPSTIAYIRNRFPSGALQASGIAVGLPWGEEGNSEVGHLTIGAGKIIYQHFPRINMAIASGDFLKNKTLLGAISHVLKNNSALNLIGIISQGNVHASMNHLEALIKLASAHAVPRINLHLFADGKDSPPKSFLTLLEKIFPSALTALTTSVRLASVSGRYYAMDRDKHWDRTQLAYQALLGKAAMVADLKTFVQSHYQKNLADEYLQPINCGPEPAGIAANDALIFFNYREDSIRQLAEIFCNPDFKNFPVMSLANIFVATMTKYFENSTAQIAFLPETVDQPLGKIIADNNKNQLRIAETEKYAHVTYFFNGFKDEPLANEYRVLIPSKAVAHHDEHPEMMAGEITNRVSQALQDSEMDFILVNYANADIIAHTGNYDAAGQAIRVLNDELAKLIKIVLEHDALMMITADHGNIEQMINPLTGLPETKHNPSPVPIYLIGKEYERAKSPEQIQVSERETIGLLSDVAPTILELMNIAKPPEMTGESLLKKFL